MEKEIIKIAIADDHPLIRKGLADYIGLFGLFDFFEIIMNTCNGKELIAQLWQSDVKPDICIVDISMPEMNGYETVKEIKKNWMSIKVLVYSMYCNTFSIIEMFSIGANGVLRKSSSPKQLQQALSSIYYNGFYLSEKMSKQKLQLFPKITEREMEFLCHCCSELTYKDISVLMQISVRTIETYRDSLFVKFDIKNRTGLALFALRNGIVCLYETDDQLN
jgi:two-component system invasion response regulator UvrY